MPFSYHCPKCNALLNPNIRVVLVASHDDKRGIVLMSPKLGDYNIICDRGFCQSVKKGETVEFSCPVCSQSLTCQADDHFAELVLINPDTPDRHPHTIRFSRVSEEHATFVYDGESVKSFGEEADLFRKRITIEGDWGW